MHLSSSIIIERFEKACEFYNSGNTEAVLEAYSHIFDSSKEEKEHAIKKWEEFMASLGKMKIDDRNSITAINQPQGASANRNVPIESGLQDFSNFRDF